MPWAACSARSPQRAHDDGCRGATRFGVGAYMGALGVLVCLVAFVPVAGYVLAVALPLLAVRMRGRQAARFAGLRTLAK